MKLRAPTEPGEKREGVIAVDRALSILEVFRDEDRSLPLMELSRRTGLDKATIIRLAKSLAKSAYLVRNPDSTWRLGPKLAQLGTRYQATFQLRDVIEPALVRLSRETGESTTFYVREQDHRVCLFRVDSVQAIRHHARLGDMFSLDSGAPSHVLLAFDGRSGDLYDQIRQRLNCVTLGERDPQVGCVSCPVFQAGGGILGALSVVGPVVRFGPDELGRHLLHVSSLAAQLSSQIGHPGAYPKDGLGDAGPFVVGAQQNVPLASRKKNVSAAAG